jgi:hypothetical protein
MSLILHEENKKHIDLIGNELLNEINVSPSEELKSSHPQPPTGYLQHKNVIDLGEITSHLDISKDDWNGRLISKFRDFKSEKVGYNEEGFEKIYSLVSNILKTKKVRECISEQFLVENIFEWLVGSYKNELNNISLSEYVTLMCNNSILEYNIYLPILYLESDKIFHLGECKFLYITEDYINTLALKVESSRRTHYIESLKSHKGQLFASCKIVAEKEKAIQLSIKKISLSVDVLRMLAPTVEYPDMPIYYDVDFRNIHQLSNNILIQEKEEEKFHLQQRRKAQPFVINQTVWNILTKNHIHLFHEFLNITLRDRTELERLILNSITNFSESIATHDLHKRVVQIFTVLESLLLPNENVQIGESVRKYLPILVSTDVEIRKTISNTIKSMYVVRSKMIHHGIKHDFELAELRILQISTRSLIIALIQLSLTKKTKQEVLEEIDNKIISVNL